MAQAKREKIVYGDATDYKEDVKNGLIIPREPSKISDSLAEDVKKGRVVARPGQADTHLAHLSFTQEALLNGTATDKQEEIAKRYYVANIDAINADRKRHGLSPITVEEAVNAAKVVYEVLNNKGKESEELKKDVESGSVIYRRVNKDLEEEVLAKNVENVFITTTTTTTTRISTGQAAAPGGRGNGRVRRSTTEEAPAPETSGSTETTQNGGTPNKKNKGDQSSETVATELPHVAPDHGTTETGSAGEGARPSNGNGGSSVENAKPVTPAQPEVKPAPVTPQPEAPVENTPTPEPPVHVETDEEKLAKYHEEDFSSSHLWYNLDNVHVMYTLHNDDLHKVIERGKTYKLTMWNTESNKAEFVEFKHIADVFTKVVHANEIDYCVRPQDVYVEGDEGKDIVLYEKSSYDTMQDQTLETMVGIVYQSHTANLAPTVYEYNSQFKWYDLNDTSHVYLVPDTYAYNNLLENLEITVKDTATDSETKMTIPNPSTIFTKEVEYDGKTYVMRPEDEYTEGGVEKNIVIVDKSMTTGFAVYMTSVLGGIKIVSNKSLVKTESSSTEDPVVNGKKLSEYTEAEFDSATTYFDLETPADVNGTLYTLRADADKLFDLNTAHDLVMMEASSKKVKLVHIDPILTTFTHEVKTESELDIMLRPQDAYVNGVTRDVVYIDKAVKDEARTVATFMHYVSTDSMTNLKPYEAPSNSETTPGTSEATPTPAPEADPIIHGKRLSEYNSTNFNRSYVYVNYNEDMSSNNYNDFSYFLTLDAINTPLERGKTYDFAMMNVNSGKIKVIHMDDPYATFTKESKTVSRSDILLRPQDEYVKGDERYIPFLIKETFDTASTIGDYCNALAVEPSDSLKPDISENYFTDHEFHITSVQSEGYCVAKGDESTIPVPGHTYHLYNISTQEAEDVVFPDIKNTYDTVNIGRQKYYYKPEYKVTDPRAVEGDADMYAYLGETIDNPSSTWLDIIISQRRVPRTITYIEPKLPEVTDTIDTTVYYDKPWFSIVPYDLSTRLYIRRDELSTNPAPQYDKQDIFTVWNAKTNAESTEYISHLGSNVFGPFDVKGESCYVFKASDDYSTVNNLEDLGVGRNIVTIPAHIMEKININDYQSITWKDILDNVKLIYTGDLYQ